MMTRVVAKSPPVSRRLILLQNDCTITAEFRILRVRIQESNKLYAWLSESEDVLKVLLLVSKVLNPSKSPLKRKTLIPVPSFLRAKEDLEVPKVTAKHFSNNLSGYVLHFP